jgi:hypothetical protein
MQRSGKFKTFRAITAAMPFIAAALLICADAQAAFESKDTKILDFSWDTPSAPILGTQVAASQRLPLDGVVTDLLQNNPTYGYGDPRDLFAWKTWSSTSISAASFSTATTALQTGKLGHLNESLLRFNVAGPQTDWFNSTALISNASLASTLTSPGALKGILLDTEYYPGVAPGTAFDYQAQPQKGSHTFAQYQAQARSVGGQFMQALKSANPNVQVMLTYGYDVAGTNPAALPNEPYGLLPSFIDGMLDQAGPNNFVHDGWEKGYGYTTPAQYDSALRQIRVDDGSISSNPSGFASSYRAGFGFWLDRGPNGQSTVWDSNNIANNQYSPAQFQFAIQEAAKRSDKYVWLHSEIAGWWNGNIPQPYVDALKSVRRSGQLERFRGTLKDSGVWESHTESSGAITQNDGITIDAVNAVTASQADYTSRTATLSIGGVAAVEVKNLTSTANSGNSRLARLGLILSNNSGGTAASALNDSRALMVLWSNNDNSVYAGVNDPLGLNQLTAIAAQDQPQNSTWLYQIERLSATTARFSILDSNGGALIGTPRTLAFSQMPGDLTLSLFAQAGDASFANAWIAAPIVSNWSYNGSDEWGNTNDWSTTYAPNAVDAKVVFGSSITAARTVFTDVPITLGSLKFDNAASYQLTGQGSLTIQTSSGNGTITAVQGSHKINLPLAFASDANISVSNGATLTLANPVTVNAGKTLTISGNLIVQTPLTVQAGGAVVLAPLAEVTLSEVPGLAAGAKLDLGSGSAVIRYSNDDATLAAIQSRIAEAYAGGRWSGGGITSSQARSIAGDGSTHPTGLGFADNALLRRTSFAGQAVDEASILISYAYAGDCNIDGAVDSLDFNLLAANFGEQGKSWIDGDVNYDGAVDSVDFNLLATNFGLALGTEAFDPALVPEPTALTIAGLAMAVTGMRRRRKGAV